MFEAQPLGWAEAEKLFSDKLSMTAEEFYALQEYYRGAAWTVTRIAELQTIGRVQRKLTQLIADGGTLVDFRAWLGDQAIVWSRAYTELVFRNATAGGYSRARWEEVNDPDTMDEFDWLAYDAVDDSRTRRSHAALDNLAWKREEFPDEYWTPNGHQCRCTIRQLNEDLLRRSGARTNFQFPTDENDELYKPDEGWRANQARDFAGTLEAELNRIRGEMRS